MAVSLFLHVSLLASLLSSFLARCLFREQASPGHQTVDGHLQACLVPQVVCMAWAHQAILSRPWGVLKARTLPAILISVLREGKSHGLRQHPETIPWQNPRQPANQYEQDDCISPIWPRMRAAGSSTDRPRLSPMHPRPSLADPFAGMPVVSLYSSRVTGNLLVANHMNTYTGYAIAYGEAGHFQEGTGLAASCAQNDLVCMDRQRRGCTSHSRELRQTSWSRRENKTASVQVHASVALGSGLHIVRRYMYEYFASPGRCAEARQGVHGTCTSVEKRGRRCALIGQCHSKLLRLAIRYSSRRVPLQSSFCVPGSDASHQMLTDTCHDSCAPEQEIKMASYLALLHAWKPVYEPNLLQPHGACKALESSASAFGLHLVPNCYCRRSSTQHMYLVPRRACMRAANVGVRSLVF
ncbi:hypothetical protein TRIATDRAFT_85934 [Trichoderma atroviride IMI 206040]|uniref:Secreted protein n=1 Tax=Hypocrea atroviridis (strain ATCC 20476 / IMI 206040) TaxID=452589 RepID=G9P0Z8_HYPAI|nr:uncharacterized protein TRIATDRAFT_85934 [Trichoderma atroviride IMI 206040]EHK43245.1 hypothetical protein TRIATDRAFT_85934 [Trichoderma atroviride IMI 206040]